MAHAVEFVNMTVQILIQDIWNLSSLQVLTWIALIIHRVNINAPTLREWSPIPCVVWIWSCHIPNYSWSIGCTAHNLGSIWVVREKGQWGFWHPISKHCCLHSRTWICQYETPEPLAHCELLAKLTMQDIANKWEAIASKPQTCFCDGDYKHGHADSKGTDCISSSKALHICKIEIKTVPGSPASEILLSLLPSGSNYI